MINIKSKVQGRQTNQTKAKRQALRLLTNVLNDETQSLTDRVSAATAILNSPFQNQQKKDDENE